MKNDSISISEQMYSALEVANLCGVVNQTAINWIKSGHLKAFNTPGGQYRIYHDDLVSFITDRGMRLPDALSASARTAGSSRSVIIIDDDAGLNNALHQYFSKKLPGFTILQSYDGFDAGAQLASHKPGFVILDLALPGVNGQELCRRIKTDPVFGNPWVFIITALEDPSLESEMRDIGADRFFRKPVSGADLVTAVTNVTGIIVS